MVRIKVGNLFAIHTLSDTRATEADTSGRLLAERLAYTGHQLAEMVIMPDSIYRIRALVAKWISDLRCRWLLISVVPG